MTPPLGLKRVKVVDLLATLISSRSDAVAAKVMACGALPVCFRLFARQGSAHYCSIFSAQLAAVVVELCTL